MRRTIFLALLATLLLVPSARAASPTQIIRDCADDSVLEGHYSISDLRNARDHLSGDVDEYSDCRDVLSRAIASASSNSNDSSSGGGGGGGTSGGGSGGGGPSSSSGGPSRSLHSNSRPSQADQDYVVGASTAQDHAAVNEAAIKGAGPADLNGRSVEPNARLATTFGRNTLPSALIVALVLLGVAALAATVPLVRRRVIAHRQP